MIGKSLEMRGPRHRVETGSGCDRPDGRMAKHHRRSVHREVFRPQGSRSPLKQFSPVIRYGDAGGHGLNVPEANILATARGEVDESLSGFEAVAWVQRSALELGRFPEAPDGGYVYPTKGRSTDG